MSIEDIWAQSAINVALRPWTSQRDAAAVLRKVAKTYPDAITVRIAYLRRQIALLEQHLPAALSQEEPADLGVGG